MPPGMTLQNTLQITGKPNMQKSIWLGLDGIIVPNHGDIQLDAG